MLRIAEKLHAVVGDKNLFTGDAIEERYCIDQLSKYRSRPAFVVRPESTEEVAGIVKIAATSGTPITPLGGRTGVVGGGQSEDGAIILSLERMNKIIEIDKASMTMTVEAGATLQTVHEAAEREGMLMPLDLGARGSATIGGNIATNAGGVRVLRWGMMRDMVIGLEAVLADGSVVSSLTKVLKDNAGYNWKHLIIGSEGTLAIVTKAVLRLRPFPSASQTALVALQSFEDAPKLLRRLEADLAGQLSSFELMWNSFYSFVSERQLAKRPRPLPTDYPLYALVESMGNHAERDAAVFEESLARALDERLVQDVVIAKSERERENLWAVRDDLGEAFRPLWPLTAFDVSMPLNEMPGFVKASESAIRSEFPQATVLYYGHAGDGNLHVVVSTGKGDPESELKVDNAVYSAVGKVGGSIAAEHGIGRAKRAFIGLTRSPEELALMRTIKRALDPGNILNPNSVLPEQ